MAKFKSHNSTNDGDGNRQKGASIFFSDTFWTENECLYKSENGYLIVLKLQSTNLSMTACKVFAPNNYNTTYFENLKGTMLDIQAGNPNHPIVIKHFNMNLENRDSENRNANIHESNARRIIKDNI